MLRVNTSLHVCTKKFKIYGFRNSEVLMPSPKDKNTQSREKMSPDPESQALADEGKSSVNNCRIVLTADSLGT